ncbi:MAG TPA: winged helix-turn-helix domain-containing protein [Terriglobales bacterium]|nr:winged helix-turn-helix domain-containing protein [Terriglobales bacterium]
MRPDSCRVFRFGPFEADVQAGELRKDGAKVSLQEQPFQVLAALLERPGELVWREDLRQQVWPEDTFVEFDHALNTAVKKIRIALGDCANSPEYVETVPKRGYRFLAAIEVVEEALPSSKKMTAAAGARRWLRRNPVSIALVTALLLSLALLGMLRRGAARASEKKMVLAVLPLEDWSDDASHARLCEGITQELITQSGHADPARLAVVPHAATVAYRHTPKTVAEVARELHADYLIEGNLRGDDERVRVTVELIRASDESRVWGEDFDREPSNSLALESEVAAAITEKAKVALLNSPAAHRGGNP